MVDRSRPCGYGSVGGLRRTLAIKRASRLEPKIDQLGRRVAVVSGLGAANFMCPRHQGPSRARLTLVLACTQVPLGFRLLAVEINEAQRLEKVGKTMSPNFVGVVSYVALGLQNECMRHRMQRLPRESD